MTDEPRADDFEELLARCLEAQADGGQPALEAELALHAQHAQRLRARVAQLARLGLMGEEGAERLGPYRLLGRLGAGGMGVVHRARDADGREVALKVLPPSPDARTRERFQREASSIASLDHPHIVRVLDVGEAQGRPYLALELVRGATLAAVLERLRDEAPSFENLTGDDLARALRAASVEQGDAIEPSQAAFERTWVEVVCRLVADVADALAHGHAAGVVHRDVKPSNVLIDADGRALLFDFGLAHLVDADSLTRTGDFAGTPFYTSPEQLSGVRDLDGRTDVFGLGATLYELLSLRRPFEGESTAAVFRAIQTRDPIPLSRLNPEVPADLETVVATALTKEREGRYESATAMAQDLRRFLAFRPILARPIGPVRRLIRSARRYPGWAAAISLLLVGLIALPIFLLWANSAIRAERDRAEESARLSNSVVEYLVGLFEGVPGEERTARQLLDEGVERLPIAFGDLRVRSALYEASGRAYALMGLHRQALPMFDRAFALAARELGIGDADQGDSLELLAQAHIALKNWEVAADLCRRNLEALSGSENVARRAEVRLTLGQALAGAEDYEAARSELERAYEVLRRRAPGEPIALALQLLGQVDLATGRDQLARERLEAALAMRTQLWSPSFHSLSTNLAALSLAHSACGDPAAAARFLERASRLSAPSAVVDEPPFALVSATRRDYEERFQDGISRLQAQQWDEAREHFEACLELVPEEPVCAYNIACALARDGDEDGAFEWIARALDWGFGNATTRLRVAREDPEVDSLRARAAWKPLYEGMLASYDRAQDYARTPGYLPGKEPSAALLVVLHDDGDTKDSILAGPWAQLARRRGWALLAPSAVYPGGHAPEDGMAWTHNVMGFSRNPGGYAEPAREALLWLEREHGTPTGPIVFAGEGAGGWVAFALAMQLPGRVSGVVLRGATPHPRSLGSEARLAEAMEVNLQIVLDGEVAPYGAPDAARLPETRDLWKAWISRSWRGPLEVQLVEGEDVALGLGQAVDRIKLR